MSGVKEETRLLLDSSPFSHGEISGGANGVPPKMAYG